MNLIYHWLIERADPEQRDEIDTHLNAGVLTVSQEESAAEYDSRRDAEMSAFEAAAAARNAGADGG